MKPILSTVLLALTGALVAVPSFAQPAENPDACLTTFDPAVDYFAQKADVEYAENFTVAYHGSYKVVTVVEPSPGAPSETYVLLQCGASLPELPAELAAARVIEVPVATIHSESATHFPMLEAIGMIDRLTGVSSAAYTTTEAVIAGATAGTIIEFAPTFTIDVETVIDGEPALFMTGGFTTAEHGQLADAGIAVVANAEWLEPTVLGRAEWVKYIALFFNQEGEAETAFDAIDAQYAATMAEVASLTEGERPLVFTGAASEGIFYAAGGRSYVAEMIADAGGRYIFADNDDTGSTGLTDIEVMLDEAAEAKVWINANSAYRTLADIVADDPRLAALPAAQAGAVWNYDRITSPGGGVAYFDLGVLRPDLVLIDLVKIFHPEVMADQPFTFYRPIAVE